jgi:hypothetical protein
MPMDVRQVRTARGDLIMMALVTHSGEKPSIIVSIDDADDTLIPTAEFTLPEAGDLRDVLRQLCEAGTQGEGRVRR